MFILCLLGKMLLIKLFIPVGLFFVNHVTDLLVVFFAVGFKFFHLLFDQGVLFEFMVVDTMPTKVSMAFRRHVERCCD